LTYSLCSTTPLHLLAVTCCLCKLCGSEEVVDRCRVVVELMAGFPRREEEQVFEYTPDPPKPGDKSHGHSASPSRKGGGGGGERSGGRRKLEYETLGASGAKGFEPPEQRLSRLTAEVGDLIKIVESNKDASQQESSAGISDFAGSDPASVAAELRVLEQRLGGLARDGAVVGQEQKAAPAAGATAGSLAVQLERLATGGGATMSTAGAGDGRVTYELRYAPLSSSVSEESKLASLENTLAAIETQLGVFDQACPFSDLQSAVMQVQRRLASLDQQRMEIIRSGVAKTMVEVEGVIKKKEELEGAAADPVLDRKANELFEFCHRWNAVAPSLPAIVSRLQSLQALHQESHSFTSRLAALEHQQEELTKLLETTSTAVQDLSKSMQENMTTVRDSMRALEGKITKAAQG